MGYRNYKELSKTDLESRISEYKVMIHTANVSEKDNMSNYINEMEDFLYYQFIQED